MDTSQEPLSVGEFTRWAEGVTDTLSSIDRKMDDHSNRLGNIEGRMSERDRMEMLAKMAVRTAVAQRKFRLSAATWSTVVTAGGGLLGFVANKLGFVPTWLRDLVK